MNINDDKKADAFLKAKVVKLWLKARDRKVKIDAFLQYININNMYGKRVSKGLVDERGGNRDGAVNSKLAGVGKADWRADFANEYVEIDATTLDLFAKKIRLDLASAIWKINKEAFRDFEECKARVEEKLSKILLN
ncbi:hypothetical protein [Campylobacter hyointestinalis]|uniref:hypothetical protein n=1 Tax=Campylobacter hyointestinalis TaxID=198 RepID=UPI000DCB5D62|nr:hypothetical protein [Campylobacter hyointestinalis]RAZ51150.1 hypothetical protein CHL10075_08460 [Campylobacter hyointestinalis subsp. lawsonii]